MDQIHQLEEQVKGVTAGLNSVRESVDLTRERILTDLTEFKRDMAEKVVAHKYEVSEQISSCAYNCKSEMAKMVASVQQVCAKDLDVAKTAYAEKLSEIKDSLKEEIRAAKGEIATQKADLMDIIRHRIKVISIVSAIVLAVMGWQWTYTSDTAKKFDEHKDSISKELYSFREEIRSFLNDDVKKRIWELQSQQSRVLLLLEAHYNESHKTRLPGLYFEDKKDK